MDGCVTKPIHEAELIAAIEDVMDAADRYETSAARRPAQAALDEDDILALVGGDLDLLRTIVELFLQDYPVRVSSMREAVSRGDAKGLQSAAHALKGAVANFTKNGTFQAAQQVESLARSGELGAAEGALGTLEAELATLTPGLIRLAGMDTCATTLEWRPACVPPKADLVQTEPISPN